ncbi:MAG: hypothetical protein J6K24_05705 [Tidjanibacter sp.]|nr:hypothetical protein [Tidjanibacter sp.]
MKKLFVLLVAMLGISLTTMADNYDTCMVKGGNGASVSVSVLDWDDDGYVKVQISSDCDDYVNVTFELKLYDKTHGQEYGKQTFVTTAQPNSNNVAEYRVRIKGTDGVRSVGVTVKGARCE